MHAIGTATPDLVLEAVTLGAGGGVTGAAKSIEVEIEGIGALLRGSGNATRIFYCGRDMWMVADELAKATPGAITIGDTALGRFGNVVSRCRAPSGLVSEYWTMASRIYAQNASGEVVMLLRAGEVNASKILIHTELPALRANASVGTRIIYCLKNDGTWVVRQMANFGAR
jgi:hypothetical protein